MKKSLTRVALSLVLLCSLLFIALPASPVSAAGTETLTITRYAADQVTIVEQITVTIEQLEAALPVQGDAVTHYWTQGPSFVPDDIWNPEETLNLKDKGALRGTDIKDICEAIGGAYPGDEIQVKAADGYSERFQYDNVYNPLPQQGPMTICWEKDGQYSGTGAEDWQDGMLLAFFTTVPNADGQLVFGNEDMRTYLPEENWHYYYEGGVNYASVHGLYIKYVTEISIYPEPPPQWNIEVTGIMDMTVDQGWFENALACHETQSWTDGSGNVWSGLPLWYLVGLADDFNNHGPGAFNDAVAAAGYTVNVTASDGYAKSFASADIARSNDYIIANQMNGVSLVEGDSNYPLKLVGNAVASSGGLRVGKIASIDLLGVPVIDTWTLELTGASDYTMTQSEFEAGVACATADHAVTYDDGAGNIYSGLPLWLLCGWVDDDIQHGDGAFNDALALAGYQIKVSAIDGYYFTFDSADVARNDGILVANKVNGEDLPDGDYPIRLVGAGFSGGSGWKVREIVSIELFNFPSATYTLAVSATGSGTVAKVPDQASYESGSTVELTATAADGWTFTGWSGAITGTANPVTVTMDADKTITATFAQNWNVQLTGLTAYTMSNAEFEALAAAYPVSCVVTNKDGTTNTYSGVALWRLIAAIDGAGADFNDALAALGYNVNIVASDGFTKTFAISGIARDDTKIIANMMDGAPLASKYWPLRYVYPGTVGGSMVGAIAQITMSELPSLTITASAGANGSIDPSGAVTAVYGSDVTFTITPDANCMVADVLVDGVSVGAVDSYTFTGVTADHTISVTFAQMMVSFSVKSMSIKYTPYQPRRDDNITASGTFQMPAGFVFNPAVDAVTLDIDGCDVVIPAGTFTKQPGRDKIYSHNNRYNRGSFFRGFHTTIRQNNAVISMTLNFTRGTWEVQVTNIDASDINNNDGVDVTLTIAQVIGTEHIGMNIDSLSFRD